MVKVTVEIDDDGRPGGQSEAKAEITRVALSAARAGIVPSNSLGVELRDIELWTQQYARQLAALHRIKARCPVVVLPQDVVIPIDVQNTIASTQLYSRFGKDGAETTPADIHRALQTLHDAGLKVGETHLERAVQAFGDELVHFLTTRKQAASNAAAPSLGSILASAGASEGTPGVDVTVYTRRPGLRVLATPRFFFQGAAALNDQVSTPVVGRLAPGDYLFGAEGPDQPKVFEDCIQKIPSNTVVKMVRA